MGNSKKKLMKEVKKKLNAKFECHVVGPHALSHEVFAFIYIYIYIYIYIWIGFIIIVYGVYINISINCVLKFNEGLISSGFL